PARRPRRENVRFHPTREHAERAGFRPCRRCRPADPPPADRRREAVTRACRLIEAAAGPPALAELAAAVGMSPYHFHRTFRRETGVTPKAYAAAHRAGRVREELGRAESVTEAIYAAGFGSSGRFYAAADGHLGMTPTAYRAGGAGVAVRYAV